MLKLSSISKAYMGNNVVDKISLDVHQNEFVSLLGPSGSGKTTLLRLISGLESVDEGEILIDGEVVSTKKHRIHASSRQIGCVFQSYALWPHMTVFENVAFPLQNKKMLKENIRKQVCEILEELHIDQYISNYPYQLSGGECQRVALARCLVAKVKLILMDEPLANLDLYLRKVLIEHLRVFHKTHGVTTLYITHDQNEALTLSHRIAVLDKGKIIQIDTPEKIYNEPSNSFISNFIGVSSLIWGKFVCLTNQQEGIVNILGQNIKVKGLTAHYYKNEPLKICLRPEAIKVTKDEENGILVVLNECAYKGGYFELSAQAQNNPEVRFRFYSSKPFQSFSRLFLEIKTGYVIPH